MRLIDADSLVKNMTNECNRSQFGRSTAKYCVKKEPTVDAQPVVHANWINPHCCYERRYGNCTFTKFNCSNCGEESFEKSNYCPHCGAKMDGEA